MTRDEIESMPEDQLVAWLALNVMGWKDSVSEFGPTKTVSHPGRDKYDCQWWPVEFRDDLAELLSVVDEDRIKDVCREIDNLIGDSPHGCYRWLWLGLTADPLTVCRAVALAYGVEA